MASFRNECFQLALGSLVVGVSPLGVPEQSGKFSPRVEAFMSTNRTAFAGCGANAGFAKTQFG